MATPLLRTKLYIPPIRPDMVSRPRLVARLNTGLYRKLTLVSAPAGFGKTTLLSEWVTAYRESKIRVAWLSLDEGDNDPARFLAYLIAAFKTIEENVGRGTLGALQSPGFAIANTPPPTEELLTTLINQVNVIPDGLILVLDDYHLITTPPVHDALSFLLDHLPGNVHLVIATRVDPPLPIARLRGHGQLTELRQADLRFTLDEIAEFLNQVMGLELSADDVATLADRVYALEGGRVALQGPTRDVFAQAEQLRSLGLAVPAAAAVMAELRKLGLTVPPDVLTLDEAEAAIVALLETCPALPSLQSPLGETPGKAKGMQS